mmetsp:Transcript_31461/g.48166  ORF Transcript_31461/g.48166 Transcript_31461/m.48166 type:complete len:218 (+) Transcript_31461:96-749(+)|eukprot:CAMPEP_0118687002 /NCGR_PEP_ID=MMETSP0800-20121206/8132_1 /TAXON_ID=210618 ORGANISM="Striatella unipunctata, Strain CCMP2910" /NCGR_SAMPLE_ID=MMETSP0800 /ASSEMBLY_ACC=CAM_ASM_000638 /LENGTH=217 /DNA_ID=CAMNT_0006584121 /DNA_START=72 /DNA_END=725 /DNA_ORIENTATION=+
MSGCMGHSHDDISSEDALGLSLRPLIDMDGVRCLNEEEPESGKGALKLHENRMHREPVLRSDMVDEDDEDATKLLLFVPFEEPVEMQTITVHTASNGAPPRKLKIFVNREDVDMEMAEELTPQAELELVPPQHFETGTIDYFLRPAGRFRQVSNISLYFIDNHLSDERVEPTEITFVGFKGKGTKLVCRAVQTVYETQGAPKDHKVPGADMGASRFV